MRILHTSDWHLGRSFHGHPRVEAQHEVLTAIVELAAVERADVVVVAGDVFDTAVPAAASLALFEQTLLQLHERGCAVIVISGNHDSPTRLGFQSRWARLAGVHIRTDPGTLHEPVTLRDVHGPVHFYAVPYLEPALLRHMPLLPGEDAATTQTPDSQAAALAWAMGRIRRDAAARGGRAVVIAHCFAAGGAAAEAAGGSERDITAGGLDLVPLPVFQGPDAVLLGHLHGRAELAEGIRYSGAPLHSSFGEAGRPRGVWISELAAHGEQGLRWAPLPVPRPLSVLRGTLDELLRDAAHTPAEQHWVKAELHDAARPVDAMRRLQQRFPYCAVVEFASSGSGDGAVGYAERVRRASSDEELAAQFLQHVRGGTGPDAGEQLLLLQALDELRGRELAR